VLPQLHNLKPIGLTHLERLTRLHQVQFTVSYASNHDEVFTIRLPAVIAAAPVAAAAQPPIAPPPLSPSPSAHAARTQFILIADDQTALASVASAYLESLGFQVATARDGQEAVNLALKLLPDLIFMDVCMPILDGLSAIRQIRAAPDSKLHTIPIICLSGGAGTADREKCAAAGATAYLGKPFGIREIDRILQDYLPPSPP
ncbi:MAG: response regulator, partial [Prosthecobacter sp.]|nr:response regulator [Prosthecobacter sp.]